MVNKSKGIRVNWTVLEKSEKVRVDKFFIMMDFIDVWDKVLENYLILYFLVEQ